LVTSEVHYMEKNAGMFSSKTLISFKSEKKKTLLISTFLLDRHLHLIKQPIFSSSMVPF